MKTELARQILFFAGLPFAAMTGFHAPAINEANAPTSAVMKAAVLQIPLSPAAVTAPEGFVGTRYRANIDGSIKKFDIDKYVKMMEVHSTKDWFWIGEQPGKWLESAALSCAVTRDKELEKKAREILARMVNAQQPDGYLGITDCAVRNDKTPLRGMDPYEDYFTLHGLITAYEVLGDKDALVTARSLADYFQEHIGPGKAEFWPSPLRPPDNVKTKLPKEYHHSEIAGHSAHYGWEGSLFIDPMLRLYQITGEKRYLDWATWVISRLDTWSGWNSFSRLDDVAAGKIGLHQLQPYVHVHTFQMNFLGFLRMYQITGDKSWLNKVEGAWRDTVERQLYITGGVSVGEHYSTGYNRPVGGNVVETCANMSWMELNQYLLELTGDPKYADVMEKLLINHVFAAQTVDGDSYRYHTPPNGVKPAQFFHGPDCCTASGHRLVSKLPLFIYAQAANTAIVNQYVASSASFKLGGGTEVNLKQETRFPEEDTVTLRVEPARPGKFTLRLRIPAWCGSPSALVNGKAVADLKPGAYLDLEREWKAGDSVSLRFPMKAGWVRHDHLDDDKARWAFCRGPVVYAVDTLWWDVAEMPAPAHVDHSLGFSRELSDHFKEDKTPAGLMGPACRAELTTRDGKRAAPLLVPFANVGKWYNDPAAKPNRNSSAYNYAVWLLDAGCEEFKNAKEPAKK